MDALLKLFLTLKDDNEVIEFFSAAQENDLPLGLLQAFCYKHGCIRNSMYKSKWHRALRSELERLGLLQASGELFWYYFNSLRFKAEQVRSFIFKWLCARYTPWRFPTSFQELVYPPPELRALGDGIGLSWSLKAEDRLNAELYGNKVLSKLRNTDIVDFYFVPIVRFLCRKSFPNRRSKAVMDFRRYFKSKGLLQARSATKSQYIEMLQDKLTNVDKEFVWAWIRKRWFFIDNTS